MTHKKNRKFHIVSIILSTILIIGIFPLAVSAAGCENCGEGEYEYEDHSFSFGDWRDENDYEHGRYYCCELCYYDSTEYAAHEYTNKYYVDSEYEHIKVYECWCGHRYDEYELHNDTNGDGKCDMCGFANKRFSVTVPAFLTLTVSEDGKVYAAVSAMIVNNSTGEIAVTDISLFSEGGWTIVPFGTNMANEKVNTKLISALSELPSDAVKTITCDRCTEFAKRQTIEKELNCSVFFADLYCACKKELTN